VSPLRTKPWRGGGKDQRTRRRITTSAGYGESGGTYICSWKRLVVKEMTRKSKRGNRGGRIRRTARPSAGQHLGDRNEARAGQ